MPKNPDDKTDRPLFPGQVEQVVFNLDQVKSLASSVRATIFWNINAFEPKAASDLAKEVGKAPGTVRFHLNELLNLELILLVGYRKRRSREEALYVRKGLVSVDLGAKGDELYNRYRTRAFKLDVQKMIRETSHFYGWMERDPESVPFTLYRRFHVRLSPERSQRLRYALADLLIEASRDQTPEDEGGVEVNAVVYIRPTEVQLRKWAAGAGLDYKELSRDGIDEA